MDRYQRSAESPVKNRRTVLQPAALDANPSPTFATMELDAYASVGGRRRAPLNEMDRIVTRSGLATSTSSSPVFSNPQQPTATHSAIITIFPESEDQKVQRFVINREWGYTYDRWLLAKQREWERQPVFVRYIRPNLNRIFRVSLRLVRWSSMLLDYYYRLLNPIQHSLVAYFILTAVIAFFISGSMSADRPLAAFSVPAWKHGWNLKQKATACRKAAFFNVLLAILVVVAPSLMRRLVKVQNGLCRSRFCIGLRNRIVIKIKGALSRKRQVVQQAAPVAGNTNANVNSGVLQYGVSIATSPPPPSVSSLTNRGTAAAFRGATPTMNPTYYGASAPPQPSRGPIRRGGDESLSSTFGGFAAQQNTTNASSGASGTSGSGGSIANNLRDYLGLQSKKGSDDDLHSMA